MIKIFKHPYVWGSTKLGEVIGEWAISIGGVTYYGGYFKKDLEKACKKQQINIFRKNGYNSSNY